MDKQNDGKGGVAVFEALEDRLLLSHSVLEGYADRGVTGGVTVDFVMYPLETYLDKTWSHWGEGIVASNGKVYTAVGDHNAPSASPSVAGNAFIYEYDPETMLIQCVADLQEGVSDFNPATDWGFGKVHGRISEGPDGNLYFASYWGDNPEGNPDYKGDYIFKLNPYNGVITDVNHVDGQTTIPDRSMPSTNMWGEGMILYSETISRTGGNDLLVYDLNADPEDAIIYLDDHSFSYNRDLFVDANGDAWFNAGSGTLQQFDISEEALGITVSGMPGSSIRRVTQPDANGYLYGTTNDTNNLFRFDPATGQFKTIMSLGRDIAGMDIDPTGKYIYYIPSAHTSSDGSPLYQVDITDINNPVRTTIVSLGSYLTSTYGFPVGGSYSLMVSQDGAVVYAQLNDDFDSRPYDPGFVAIHIPPGEATFKGYPVTGPTSIEFTDVAGDTGIVAIADQYSHTAAWGDVNGDGYPDLYFGSFTDGPSRLLMNNAGESFTEWVQGSINIEGRSAGSVFVDLDNDADLDLVVANNDKSSWIIGNHVYRNEGDGTFTDVTAGSGLVFPAPFTGRNVMPLDYNGDGLLDLYMQEDDFGGGDSSRLMRNEGGFYFTDQTVAAGIGAAIVGIGGAVGDLNGDTWGDIVTVYIPGHNFIYINDQDGTFHLAPSLVINTGWPDTSGGDNWMAGSAMGDLDNDGDLDLVIGQHYESAIKGDRRIEVRVYRNDGNDGNGDPILTDITSAVEIEGIYAKQPHVEIQDFDNDGYMDILTSATIEIAGDPMPVIYHNTLGTGTLGFELPPGMNPAVYDGEWINPRYYPGSPTADYNRDGRLDIFGEEVWPDSADPVLFQNIGATEGFLDVMIDTGAGTDNNKGIGATVRVYEAGQAGESSELLGTQIIETGNGFSSGSTAVAHFGTPMNTQYSSGSNARAHGGWAQTRGFVDVEVVMPCDGPVWTATVATNRNVIMPGGGGINMKPSASFTADTSAATGGNLLVHFDGTSSFDPDGVIVSYQWNFGDTQTGTGATVSHTYTSTGTYNVTLTVIDNDATPDDYAADVVIEAPTIITQPSSQAIEEGQWATFSVEVTGSEPMSYVWEENDGGGWSAISGANESSYTTPIVTLADNGNQYRCTASNNLGSEMSSIATLSVSAATPMNFTAQPTSQSVSITRKAKFTATVSGSWPFDYQWQKNTGGGWTDVSGAGGTLLSSPTTLEHWTPLTVLGDDGDQYRVQVTNVLGTVTSNAATLNVSNPTVVSETWTGSDGDPWPAQWSEQKVTGSMETPLLDIQGNRGRISKSYAGADGTYLAYINTHNAENVDQTTLFMIDINSSSFGLIARRADGDSDTYYYTRVTSQGSGIKIWRSVNGSEEEVASGSFGTVSSSVDYKMRFVVQTIGGETQLKAKIWQASQGEPSSWNVEATDSTSQLQGVSGRFGVRRETFTHRTLFLDDYSATIYEGAVNIDPVASFTGVPSTGEEPLNVDFDASASNDPIGRIVSYGWNFGDGEAGSGETVSHEFTLDDPQVEQTFTVTLTVTDDDGATGQTDMEIDVGPMSDHIPPKIDAMVFNKGADQRSCIGPLELTFSEAVNVAKNDLSLYDHSTGSYVDLTDATFSYEAGTYLATWDFKNVTLSDADYTATLSADAVTDTYSNKLDGDGNGVGGDDYVYKFHHLFGDANGERVVNVGDLGILAANYGTSGNWWELPGDLNNSDTVDVGDLGILAAHYGEALGWYPDGAPTGLGATGASASQIDLGWTDNASDEVGFRLERDGGGGWVTYDTLVADTISYNDTPLPPSTQYSYRVTAYNNAGVGAAPAYTLMSNAATAETDGLAPAAPTGLSATAASYDQIDLSWTDNASDEDGFKIERAPDDGGNPGTFAQIDTAGANAAAYSDTTVAPSTTYHYRVRAYNTWGDSGYSNTDDATTPSGVAPAGPSGLGATAVSGVQINLDWTDNASDEDGFKIERAPDVGGNPGTFAQIDTAAADATTYSDTGLSHSTTYHYRVRAYNTYGDSGYSNEVSVATLSNVITEDWTGSDNDPWPSQWSRLDISGVPPIVTIQSNSGEIATSDDDPGIVVMYVNTTTTVDSNQLVKLQVSSNVPEGGLIARLSDSNNDTFYGVEVGTTKFDDLEIFKMVDGSYTALYTGGDGSQIPNNTWYWMRFEVTQSGGLTNLKVKLWADGGAEPGSWTAEVSDSTAALQNVDGRIGTWGDMSHAGRKVTFDDYYAEVDSGGAGGGMMGTSVFGYTAPASQMVDLLSGAPAPRAVETPVVAPANEATFADAASAGPVDLLSPMTIPTGSPTVTTQIAAESPSENGAVADVLLDLLTNPLNV